MPHFQRQQYRPSMELFMQTLQVVYVVKIARVDNYAHMYVYIYNIIYIYIIASLK